MRNRKEEEKNNQSEKNGDELYFLLFLVWIPFSNLLKLDDIKIGTFDGFNPFVNLFYIFY